MPVVEDASYRIRGLGNIFKAKIYIFTSRPWPDAENKEDLIKHIEYFCKDIRSFSLKLLLLKVATKLRFPLALIKLLKEEPIKVITKQWLKKNNIIYNKLVFEKGNDYSSDTSGNFRNRFYISRKEKIRFFVEDDLEKAIKLAYTCDVVFLMKHPYNQPNDKLQKEIKEIRRNLLSNIIVVNNWTEIYQHLRRLV
ncbi:MAG: hypothetical protein NC831_08950 [Candidatus Omnitrophica bacterium]|nr:hypothetical protein [Candidatus Omnitrophota bacterium]